MNDRRSSRGRLGRWHALVEEYTPDGMVGRLLLGAGTGTVGLWLVAAALFEIPRWGLTLAAVLWAPALLAAGVPLLAFAALVLWPAYLSLIGTIESAGAYDPAESGGPETRGVPAADDARTDADDPFADLKAMYERGEIGEDEFERRLEARLLDGDYQSPPAEPLSDVTGTNATGTNSTRERSTERG
ncbi:SHOCT domain-containing protein [Halobiforma nitratireducens]|uniref:SHOCT domain-containing protein n=1 Tax=Halobiforma nitratireducens JCM 10879 TaxID=1227454 RepID=M0M921_9EURY|nr:SHOCT domain-containing protein [Halobiforma nitratireducens]EMA40900.1 hypothetical protein C446_06975 [Halobiforma nitratireducens JCM 10879]